MSDAPPLPSGWLSASSWAAVPGQRLLLGTALVHALLFVVCLPLLLFVDAPSVTGVHPALKPAKFFVSIAFFLATMAALLPSLPVSSRARTGLAWVLSVTMIAEMAAIAGQALCGTTSHFNVDGLLNAVVWGTMILSITVATLAMLWTTIVATRRPLRAADGDPMAPSRALAWRAGLWLFLFSAVSGYTMGGRGAHSVGGDDGGPGMAVTNWSTTHGDLRVSHFFSLHAIQLLPLLDVFLAGVVAERHRAFIL